MVRKYSKRVKRKEYYSRKKNPNKTHIHSYLIKKKIEYKDELEKWIKKNDFTITKTFNFKLSDLKNINFIKKYKKIQSYWY